jgi:prolyl 4-hydroxylase
MHLIAAILFLLSFCTSKVPAELFTAIVDLERLLETEKSIASLLDTYLQAEDERLAKLRFFRDNYHRIHTIASQDSESYLSNPVNAYLLVKRLTMDWKAVESLVVTGPAETGRAAIANLTSRVDYVTSFPSAEDLSGAAAALIRLQDTYQLETAAIARGQIPVHYSHQTSSPKFISNDLELTAGDCFELGRHSYTNGDYYHTVLWMQESLHRVQDENPVTADVAEILEYLAFSTFKQGNVHEALRLTYRLLDLVPYHQRALGNRDYYINQINTESQQKRGDDGDVPVDAIVKQGSTGPKEPTDREIYESLCRGESRMSEKIRSQLKCYYWTERKHPFLTLTHVKVEEAYKKPLVLQFHDVISDEETQVIRELSGPRLKRATVQNSQTGQLETASYRISKSSWLKNADHPVVERVSRRIEHIIGLTTETAEELQVVNYGIGGHYDTHFDFARKEETNAFKNLGTGNRIATWMFYMSHVEAGGATVFPELGVTIWPEKGAAAFWYNLHRNGEGDMLTRHAACPVLVGSKWVANKWFHEQGQEFRRPCGKNINS